MAGVGPSKWPCSIRSAFVFAAIVVSILAWSAWFHDVLKAYGYYPGIGGLASILLLLAALCMSWRKTDLTTSWSLVVIAWHTTFLNVVWTTWRIANVTDVVPLNWDRWRVLVQESLSGCVVSGATLPLFITLFVLWRLIYASRYPPTKIRRYLLGSAIIGLTNAALYLVYFSAAFGTLMVD